MLKHKNREHQRLRREITALKKTLAKVHALLADKLSATDRTG